MIKHLMTPLVIVTFLSQSANAQTFDFNSVTTGGAIAGGARTVDIVNVDNIYSVGEFTGNVDFNADPSTSQNINVSTNSMFIQSTNVGNPETYQPLVWVKSIVPGSGATIHPTAICSGTTNFTNGLTDLYIVGNFSGTVDFNPDPSVTTNLTSSGGSDAFILKMLSNGTFVYAKRIGGSGNDNIKSVTHNGSVNVVGTFSGTVDLNPNIGIQNATANGSNSDIFIVKLDDSGNFTWGKIITGSQVETPFSSCSAVGEIVVVGMYEGTVDFNPSTLTTSLTTNSSTSFLAKYDDSGNLVWVTGQSNATSAGVGATAITDIYNSGKGYYVCGYSSEIIAFSTSPDTEIGFAANNVNADFIAKFNTSGVVQWIKPIDNPTGTPQSSSTPFSIAGSSDGIYIAGSHFGQTDFDPGAGLAQLPIGEDGDYFAKYDFNGNFGFVRLIEKTSWGGQPKLCAQHLHPSWTRVIVCGGTFNGTQDFDFSGGVNNRTSVGTGDFYVTLMDIIP